MTGIEFVVGYLVAWAVRKARRVGQRTDTEVDRAIDAGMDRLHDLIARKLGSDPALTQLETEAAAGATSPRTEQRVRLAVEEAEVQDPQFAAQLEALVAEIRQAETARGDGAVAVGGNLDIHAEYGSAAAFTMGRVTIGGERPDPHPPGQPSR
jgi:hypothetical protein